jgi:hypothetical protein
MIAMALLLGILLLFALQGCGTSGTSDSGNWGGPESSTTTTTGYAVGGRIISPVTLAPLPGMRCTLAATSGTYIQSAATDIEGAYSFSGVPAGNCRLTTTKEGNITDTSYFTVTRDMTVNLTSLKEGEWSAVMGADHPYDATMAYVTAQVDHTGGGTPPVQAAMSSRDPGKDGVVVDLFSNTQGRGSGYESRCYFDVQGKADWNATATSSIGVALFYRTLPEGTYTMKAAKEAHTFDDITDVTPVRGEFTNYLMPGEPTVAKTFEVTIVNNSKVYTDSDIYMTLKGKASSGSDQYYYDFTINKMVKFDSTPPSADHYATTLDKLPKADGTPTRRVFNEPLQNTVSARIYLSFKKPLHFYANGGEPAFDGGLDYNTVHDKFEASCDGTQIGANTTCVDFFGIGITMEFVKSNTVADADKVGFNITKNSEITDDLYALGTPWTELFVFESNDPTKAVIRMIAPHKKYTSESSFQASSFKDYFQKAIDNGWTHYAKTLYPFSQQYGAWTYTGKVAGDLLSISYTPKPSGDNGTKDWSKPTSYQIFACTIQPTSNGPQANLSGDIGAAFNRGVFCKSNWSPKEGENDNYFVADSVTNADGNGGKMNMYAAKLRKKAFRTKCYSFPYDDYYNQSSFISKNLTQFDELRITIPEMPAMSQ